MGIAALALLARRPWSVPVAIAGTARGVQVLLRALPSSGGRGGADRSGADRGDADRGGADRSGADRGGTDRGRLAVRLSLRGLGWALRQESALVLRHWWPAMFGAAVVSRTARRMIVSAMAVDLVAGAAESSWRQPVTIFAGRRLDDFAYGAGLWWGALRSGSLDCLKLRLTAVRWRGRRSRPQSCRPHGEPVKVAKGAA
jgi:mycofactocin glycosyltransferase